MKVGDIITTKERGGLGVLTEWSVGKTDLCQVYWMELPKPLKSLLECYNVFVTNDLRVYKIEDR